MSDVRQRVLAFLGDDHLAYDLDGLVAAVEGALGSGKPFDLDELAAQYELPEESDR